MTVERDGIHLADENPLCHFAMQSRDDRASPDYHLTLLLAELIEAVRANDTMRLNQLLNCLGLHRKRHNRMTAVLLLSLLLIAVVIGVWWEVFLARPILLCILFVPGVVSVVVTQILSMAATRGTGKLDGRAEVTGPGERTRAVMHENSRQGSTGIS